MTMTTFFRTGYMDGALTDLDGVIRRARADLKDLDFDTLVGTGFSGSVVIPTLARSLRKKFVLVRKENDDSHHGGGKLIGELGARWVFVDDFVSSGRTKIRVIQKVEAAATDRKHVTTHVADYLYAYDTAPRLREPELTGQQKELQARKFATVEPVVPALTAGVFA